MEVKKKKDAEQHKSQKFQSNKYRRGGARSARSHNNMKIFLYPDAIKCSIIIYKKRDAYS
jgi:hypothetical protein